MERNNVESKMKFNISKPNSYKGLMYYDRKRRRGREREREREREKEVEEGRRCEPTPIKQRTSVSHSVDDNNTSLSLLF